MSTIEAELSKKLNISWADARDLASYARGKVGIIPGDKLAEQTHRQSILTAAIKADKQLPKKRILPKRGPEISSNLKQDPPAGPLAKAFRDQSVPTKAITMDRGNTKVANEAAAADETTKQKETSSWVACWQCLDIVGACCELCSFCNC